MRLRNSVEELLNDGHLLYGQRKTVRDELKKKIGESFVVDGSLFFNYQTINASFDQFVVGNIGSVDLKIKCYNTSQLEKSHIVKIDEVDYEVLEIDPDKSRKYAFVFLRKLGG